MRLAFLVIMVGFSSVHAACIETVDGFAGLSCDEAHPCRGKLSCIDGRCGVPPDKLSCESDVDCQKLGGGRCDPADSRCYGCLSDADCAGGRCNELRFCQPCLEDCDCGSGASCDQQSVVWFCAAAKPGLGCRAPAAPGALGQGGSVR